MSCCIKKLGIMKLVETAVQYVISEKSPVKTLTNADPREKQNDDFDDEEFEDELGDNDYIEPEEDLEEDEDWAEEDELR